MSVNREPKGTPGGGRFAAYAGAEQDGPELEDTATYTACFTPEAWHGDQAVEVLPEGPQYWDVTGFAREKAEYLQRLETHSESLNGPFGAVDNDDVFPGDPDAPGWVRDWAGPSTTRITRNEPGHGNSQALYPRRPLTRNELVRDFSGRYPYFGQETPHMDAHIGVTLALVNTGRYSVDDAEWHIGHAGPGEPRVIEEEFPDGCVFEGKITQARHDGPRLSYRMTYPDPAGASAELERRGFPRLTAMEARTRLERGKATQIGTHAMVRPSQDGDGRFTIEPAPGRDVIGHIEG